MTFGNMCLECIPARFSTSLMIFLANLLLAMVQANLPMALLAMAESTCRDENGTLVRPANFGPRYKWSLYHQCLLVGSLFVGQSISMIPSGYLLDKFRIAKSALFYAAFIVAALQFASPLAAELGFMVFIAVRFTLGILIGTMWAAIHKLTVAWTLPHEMEHYTMILLGSYIGMILALPMFGIVIETLGWSATFCFPAFLAIAFAIFWRFLVFETPVNHPRISVAERNLLLTSRSRTESWFPTRMSLMLTSPPFWVLLLLHWANSWGHNFVLIGVPLFLYKVVGFKLGTTCFLISICFAARLSMGILFGLILHCMRSTDLFSESSMRKGFCIFSHIIPGLLLLGVPFYVNRPIACFALILCSFGINGAVAKTSFLNVVEISPNFTESLVAIANACASISGFVVATFVAVITTERNTMDEWRTIFWIGSGVYIVPGILFMLLGSARIQAWNDYAKEVSASVIFDRNSSVNTDVYF